jgi:hypothetical protein
MDADVAMWCSAAGTLNLDTTGKLTSVTVTSTGDCRLGITGLLSTDLVRLIRPRTLWSDL